MNVLLTSAGFNTTRLAKFFTDTINKDTNQVKALFIITAAVNPDAIQVLPKCLEDLLKVGILKEHITVYDMHKTLSYETIEQYDVVYICGGDTEYLLKRVNEGGFRDILLQYIAEGGYVVGVSAGSLIMSNSLQDNLGLISCKLYVHCGTGSTKEEIKLIEGEEVYLTNDQAIYLSDRNKGILVE